MHVLDLNGEWRLNESGQRKSIPAQVPGDVMRDLLDAGTIKDPYYRDNEKDVQWVGDADWTYRRSFEVDTALLTNDRLVLRCEGLDTMGTIIVNGSTLGHTDNMFRTWEFEVTDLLKPGTNRIEIQLASSIAYIQKRNAERALPAWGVGNAKVDSGAWIRKQPCNFGWDWGPALVTSGIWRDVSIIAYSDARIADIHLTQTHTAKSVTVNAAIEVERVSRRACTVAMTLRHKGRVVGEARAAVKGKKAALALKITNPKLWWPAGMGEQPLYEVEVELLADEDLLDASVKRIGLRRLELVRNKDRWGESFMFAANGKAFFSKGANWIPADAILSRLSYADYHRLLSDTAAANMNMLRVWGGGIYEHDMFYEICDELGICVWQDFMFACSTYPTFDEAWMETFSAEAEDNIRRLRHHACIALWCGNNELEQGLVADAWTKHAMSWKDYSRLFDKALPKIVKRLDPETDYWPGSPHTPKGNRRDFNDPTCGDAHLWQVWHGRKPFEWYRTCEHRFNSEFGFQSFPEPRVVASFTKAGDRNITSPVMEWHQRSGIGNAVIMQYMLDWYRMPRSFDMTLWLSQILHGVAMKYAVEHWRRSMPRGMGTLYWQLNDCWPVASWASIDSAGNWKALQYMARDFYAPALVSGLEDTKRGTVEVHVSNDHCKAINGTVRWTLTDVAGATIDSGSIAAKVGERKSRKLATLKLKEHLLARTADDLVLWLKLDLRGTTVSSNFVTFARPKRMEWRDPALAASVKDLGDGSFELSVRAKHPAPWTWIELTGTAARYSDNFFHLAGGETQRVTVSPETTMSRVAFTKKLTLRSLRDTYTG